MGKGDLEGQLHLAGYGLQIRLLDIWEWIGQVFRRDQLAPVFEEAR
jgi:hypothetical protein